MIIQLFIEEYRLSIIYDRLSQTSTLSLYLSETDHKHQCNPNENPAFNSTVYRYFLSFRPDRNSLQMVDPHSEIEISLRPPHDFVFF